MKNASLMILVVLALAVGSTFSQMVKPNLRSPQLPPPLPSTGQPLGTGAQMGGINPSPRSYSDFYKSSLKSYHRPPVNAWNYTLNTQFYHRPTVSPYLNLTRRPTGGLNNYYQYVRPELNRRAQATPSPKTARPGTVSPYFNNIYGR